MEKRIFNIKCYVNEERKELQDKINELEDQLKKKTKKRVKNKCIADN